MAAGEEAAFREFHREWFARIFGYCLMVMRGDHHAAKDVSQETLLRVVRHVRRFATEDDFWNWLRRLARTAAADYGKKRSRYRRVLDFFSLEISGHETPADDDRLLESVNRGLESLDEKHRRLLCKKYSEHWAVSRIAASEGLSESSVESRLARARAELREAVAKLLKQNTHE